MSKFKRATNTTGIVEDFVSGAEERSIPKNMKPNRLPTTKISFLLKLEHDVHELLKSIAEAEDRSMQWMLRKMTAEAIKRKAADLGIAE